MSSVLFRSLHFVHFQKPFCLLLSRERKDSTNTAPAKSLDTLVDGWASKRLPDTVRHWIWLQHQPYAHLCRSLHQINRINDSKGHTSHNGQIFRRYENQITQRQNEG